MNFALLQSEAEFRSAVKSKDVTCSGYSYTVKCQDYYEKLGKTASSAARRQKEEKIAGKATGNESSQNTISNFT